jgi:hygromycin-B 7''-O-kinase
MQHLLPRIDSSEAYYRIRHSGADTWEGAIHTLLRRHGLHTASITRFPDGENPVFDLDGRFVLKLVPKLWSQVVDREVECLGFLDRHREFPAARLLGHGKFEDWAYMITTRLPGVPLPALWGSLDREARLAAASDFGSTLRSLHRLPLGGFAPGGPSWAKFIAARIGDLPTRPGMDGLRPCLRDTAVEFVRAAGVEVDPGARVLLHGDLAPENLLAVHKDFGCSCSGVIDFGNAMSGPPLYDFAASTALLVPGDRAILERFFEGYGLPASAIADSRGAVMAYTLLHPLGNIPALLGLIPGLADSMSWDEISRAFWPD